jgi:uncharacterized flavoprotein (TIGR03862 family)
MARSVFFMNNDNNQATAVKSTDALPLAFEVAVIGGGPAGLMAAEVLSAQGHAVHLFDAMPSVGRKFLLAGKGGMNLTHAEPLPAFQRRYFGRSDTLRPMLDAFGPQQVRDWVAGLGIETFVGSSQRVFPADMKAAPLLRAWLHRLRHPEGHGVPVTFHMRHRWQGWDADDDHVLVFNAPSGAVKVRAKATVLALGGASWARLGSDGAMLPALQSAGLPTSDWQPSNCGFEVAASGVHGMAEGWSPFFKERFAGSPLKSVSLTFDRGQGEPFQRRGEFVITETGIEGSLVYAASSHLREAINRDGFATLHLDLLPDRSVGFVADQTAHPRGARSLSAHLKSRLGLDGVKMGLLNELLDKETLHDSRRLAGCIKALPLTLLRTRPIDEAISSAGGVAFEGLDDRLMARNRPGLFVAGELLDWEAPTGGYLLTACWSTGAAAGQGAALYLTALA